MRGISGALPVFMFRWQSLQLFPLSSHRRRILNAAVLFLGFNANTWEDPVTTSADEKQRMLAGGGTSRGGPGGSISHFVEFLPLFVPGEDNTCAVHGCGEKLSPCAQIWEEYRVFLCAARTQCNALVVIWSCIQAVVVYLPLCRKISQMH